MNNLGRLQGEGISMNMHYEERHNAAPLVTRTRHTLEDKVTSTKCRSRTCQTQCRAGAGQLGGWACWPQVAVPWARSWRSPPPQCSGNKTQNDYFMHRDIWQVKTKAQHPHHKQRQRRRTERHVLIKIKKHVSTELSASSQGSFAFSEDTRLYRRQTSLFKICLNPVCWLEAHVGGHKDNSYRKQPKKAQNRGEFHSGIYITKTTDAWPS